MSFRLFGIRFTITVPFCLLLVFMLLVDRTGLMGWMLLAVLLHEGGHLVCMAAASARPRAIRLQAGTIRIEKSGRLLTRREELRIAAGGPLTNLFCAGSGYILYGCTGTPAAALFFAVHLLYGLFNLLPLLGLDGGTICYLFLSRRLGEERAGRCCKCLSWFLSAFILLAGGFLVTKGNPALLFTGVYLIFMQALKGGGL